MENITHNEVEDYYNKRYQEDKEDSIKPWQIAEGVRPYNAYPMILDYLNVKPGTKILDVACGRGYLLKAAEEKGVETYGIDISEIAINLAKTNTKNAILKVSKAEEIPFEEKTFDYVTCLGSLEHFLKPEEAVKGMVKAAKDDALFCIMVPNADFIYWKIKSDKGTHQSEVQETLRTLEEWKKILEDGGLKIEKIHHDEYNFKQPIFADKRPLFIARRFVLRTIRMLLPLKYTYQFVFMCKKNISLN